MDGKNCLRAQIADFGEAFYWRHPDRRQTVKRRMMEGVYKHVPYLMAHRPEVKRIVESFEQDLYLHAKSKQEYFQRLEENLKEFMQLFQMTDPEYQLMRSSSLTKVGSLAGMHEIVFALTNQAVIIDLTSVQTPPMTEKVQHSPNLSQQEVKLVGAQQLGTSINNSVGVKDWKDQLLLKVKRLRNYQKPLVVMCQQILETCQQEQTAETMAEYGQIKKLIQFMSTHLGVTRSQITPDYKQTLDEVENTIQKLLSTAVLRISSLQQKESVCSNMQATHLPTCQFSSTASGEDATNLTSSYGISGSLQTSDQQLKRAITSVTYVSENTDETHHGSETNYSESVAMEQQPIHRLIKIVSEMSQHALSDCMEDIRSVVCANDMNFCQSPSVGPKIVSDEDLYSLTNSWAKVFLTGQPASSRKRKIEFDVVPYDHMSRRNANANDNSEVPFTNGYTKPSAEVGNKVNGALLQELREVNKRLIDVVVDTSEEDIDYCCSLVGGAAEGKGTILKCCFVGISVNFQSKSGLPVDVGALFQPLRLLVPTSYPLCSPVFLDNMDVKLSTEHDDFTTKARAKLQLHLRRLSLPMSIADIVTSWEICARQVVDEYAIRMGCGTFSSRHGSWKRLV